MHAHVYLLFNTLSMYRSNKWSQSRPSFLVHDFSLGVKREEHEECH